MEVSVNIIMKNSFQYDYFPDFLFCLKNEEFTNHGNHSKTKKVEKYLKVTFY